MHLIRNPKDFYAGLLFMAFGLAALLLSGSYPVGSASRMGPGYFPRVLGTLIIVLSAALSLRGLRSSSDPQSYWRWRPLVIVLASVGLFSVTATWLGLAVASLLLVFASSAASHEFRWREALISGLILGVAAVLVFVLGLGMPLPVWPTFIGGH
jgi:putative tricarboxylic transport membrane protein